VIVDAHAHLCGRPPAAGTAHQDGEEPPWERDYGVDELLSQLAAAGVDRVVLVGRDPAHTGELLAHAERVVEIAGVVAVRDLAAEGLADDLRALRGLPGGRRLVAVRYLARNHAGADHLDAEPVQAGVRVVADADLALELAVRPEQLPGVVRAAIRLPDLRIVLDHLGGARPDSGLPGLRGWLPAARDAAQWPNVSVKASGLVTRAGPAWTDDDLRPYVVAALRLFGPRRVMFGSDWPVCLPAASYARVLSAVEAVLPAADDDRREVLGRTAARVYRLPGLDPAP